MDRQLFPNARRRALALGALATLIVPACASDRGETVARVPAGTGTAPPPMAASAGGPRTASAPPGYPWAGGASLPTAIARAPGSEAR
jgi:hypothetical protein